MNTIQENKISKSNKYLIILIISLFVFFLGSSIILYSLLVPFSKITNISIENIKEALTIFSNYFSDKFYDKQNMPFNEYAKIYFGNDPVLFENIKILLCCVQFASYAPLLIIFLYFLREDLIIDFKRFIKNFDKYIVIIVICIVSIVIFGGITGIIYQKLGIEGSSVNEDTIKLLLDSKGKYLMIAAVVIFAPFVEEIIFRKLMIDTFEKKFKLNPFISILISCLIFSFIHVDDVQSLVYIFQYIIITLPICFAYHFSKNNIFCTITIHFLNNLISVVFACLLIA